MISKNQAIIKKLLEKKFDVQLRDSETVFNICDDIIECIVDYMAPDFFDKQADIIEMVYENFELKKEVNMT